MAAASPRASFLLRQGCTANLRVQPFFCAHAGEGGSSITRRSLWIIGLGDSPQRAQRTQSAQREEKQRGWRRKRKSASPSLLTSPWFSLCALCVLCALCGKFFRFHRPVRLL